MDVFFYIHNIIYFPPPTCKPYIRIQNLFTLQTEKSVCITTNSFLSVYKFIIIYKSKFAHNNHEQYSCSQKSWRDDLSHKQFVVPARAKKVICL